ncbi:polymorphic toxin type 44 domain-containing protein [Dokdonella sp.]|uniref:polymorphic toxin type 44 domain-containing protein n=1 Tax=Dokdonella sp. TaxID=2291710 RepID=UPI0025C47A9F|nr:polymorphic toxin type 44 domain-containing protein [Dokdonella sp.]MBX3691870.1 hypothetical protein [Dokdonella sp.]MCW5569003.1 hypothetical protein [Dokdonella sp.]
MTDTLDTVRDRLAESLTDWDVTEDDLKDIHSTLASVSPSEINDVVAQLGDEELQHWADEANSWVNGLSAGDRDALLNTLAGALDGTQLARVADAFGVEPTTAAVIRAGDATQKVEYLDALGSQIQGGPQAFTANFGSMTTHYGNAEAHAAADVLASLADSPNAFADAVRRLDQAGKLDGVLEAASGHASTTISTGAMLPPVTLHDFQPATLDRIIGAAQGGDLALRTTVFESAAEALGAMQSAISSTPGGDPRLDATADNTAKALSGLLGRDEAIAAGIGIVPEHPPTASPTANIELASQHRDFPLNLPWFKDQVDSHAPWDYKQQGAQYENFGNFNYGMTAAAAGIPEDVALRAAGWKQQQSGTSRPEWGGPLDFGGSYGDDPRDQQQIRDGYAYHRSGLWRVWGD